MDEVADLPPSVQASLLRVIQEREVLRVGATRPLPVDIRVIAASNRILTEAVAAGLLDPLSRQPVRQALLEFLVHGLRYVFPPKLGPLGRGMPTGRAALPLSRLMARDEEPPPVWPDPEGKVRGLTLQPLYPSVPKAARQDRSLYELLSLVDSLREGRARERKLAEAELTRRLLR